MMTARFERRRAGNRRRGEDSGRKGEAATKTCILYGIAVAGLSAAALAVPAASAFVNCDHIGVSSGDFSTTITYPDAAAEALCEHLKLTQASSETAPAGGSDGCDEYDPNPCPFYCKPIVVGSGDLTVSVTVPFVGRYCDYWDRPSAA